MEDASFKDCPFCKERIRKEAVKCRYCGEWLEEAHEGQKSSFSPSDAKSQNIVASTQTQTGEISRGKKLLILAGFSTCAVLLLKFTNILPLVRPPQIHILTYSCWVAGQVLAFFTCGAPFAAWIKGRTGLVIGLIVTIIALGLAILGNSIASTNNSAPVSNNKQSGKGYEVTAQDPNTGKTLKFHFDSKPSEYELEKRFSDYYIKTFNETKVLAERGDAKAQYDLGNYYDTGQGVAKNVVEAMKWFRKSAEQNYAPAQCNLWVSYHTGSGVPADEVEAMKWLRKAVAQDDADAESMLGFCYKVGQGVDKDDVEAAKWYRKAAEQDLTGTQAVYAIGEFYFNGQGVPKDYVEAYKWFKLASVYKNIDAERILPVVKSLMTAEQIAEGERLANKFKPRKN